MTLDSGYLNAYELLGRIYAWEGKPSKALEAFAHRVSMDVQNPFLHYFPADAWIKLIQGEDENDIVKLDELMQVYAHWRDRFPTRAEVYTEIGLLCQCYLEDPSTSENVVRSGIEKQAIPIDLLLYYQSLLSQGDASACLIK